MNKLLVSIIGIILITALLLGCNETKYVTQTLSSTQTLLSTVTNTTSVTVTSTVTSTTTFTYVSSIETIESTLEFDTYTNPQNGFSIKYPSGWSYDDTPPAPNSGFLFRVDFSGTLNGVDNEINVSGPDDYEQWYAIFSSPLAAHELVRNGSINGTTFNKYYQDIKGKESIMYLFDSKNSPLFIFWSFPSGTIEHEVVDSYIITMFESAMIP
jgi:hypothetical protein